MDNISEIGKYLKETSRKAELALKRDFEPPSTVEKIRDIFDTTQPFDAMVETPDNISRAILNVTFGKKLPAVGCCGDCYCGVTESYTSDSLIDDNIYVSTAYVPNSTVVYLDGVQVTKGVEYEESNPGAKQLEINIPFSTIVISYVYTVGNCSEETCINAWPCPEYVIISGLATVFADRYDRGAADPYPYGGCGYYATSDIGSVMDIPVIGDFGLGYVDTTYAFVDNNIYMSGASIEIATAINGSTNIQLTGQVSFTSAIQWGITFNANDTYNYTLSSISSYTYQSFPDNEFFLTTPNQSFTKTQSNIPLPSTGFSAAPKFVNAAQDANGNMTIRAWVQGTNPSEGIIQTLTLADAPVPIQDIIRIPPHLVGPAIRSIRIVCIAGGVQAVKIGTAFDPGGVPVPSGNSPRNATLSICKAPPPLYSGYFGACYPETYTATSGGGGVPTFSGTIAFPVQAGAPAEELFGTGRLVDINHHMGTISALGGSHVIVRGLIRTFFALNHPFSVIFQSFNQDIPTYNNQNFTGTQIASMVVPSNQSYIPFEIQVPVFDDLARWSFHIPDLESYAQSLAYIGGGFLFPPNHGVGIGVGVYEFEVVPQLHCNSRDICGDCQDEVCPQINDSFNDDTLASFVAPSSLDVSRATESGATMIIEQGDGTRLDSIGNGVGRVTWEGADVDAYSWMAFTYPTSVFTCRLGLEQDVFGSFEFKVNTLSPISGYADILWGGFDTGIQAFISFGGGAVIESEIGSTPLPVSLSANVWMTGEYQTDGVDILARVYPTGTAPPDWTRVSGAVDVEGLNNPQPFFVAVGYDQIDTASNYNAEVKNIIIRRA